MEVVGEERGIDDQPFQTCITSTPSFISDLKLNLESLPRYQIFQQFQSKM